MLQDWTSSRGIRFASNMSFPGCLSIRCRQGTLYQTQNAAFRMMATKQHDNLTRQARLPRRSRTALLPLHSIIIAALVSFSTAPAQSPHVSGGTPESASDAIVKLLQSRQNDYRKSLADKYGAPAPDAEDFSRDSGGAVVSAYLTTPNINIEGFGLISQVRSIRELTLMRHAMDENLTPDEFAVLSNLTNLNVLKIRCFGKLNRGVFEQICKLPSLRELGLVLAVPPEEEYSSVTNLTNLSVLRVSYCSNFGDKELCLLTNLTALKNLVLAYDGFSPQGTNVLSGMRGNLTNCVARAKPEADSQ